MEKLQIYLLLLTFILYLHNTYAIQEQQESNAPQSSEIYDEDISDEEENELLSPNFVLPKQIFNDGKPFYAQKDPISGQFDFNAKKPAGIEPEYNEVIDPKEKIVLSSAQPNIHDFLNLPVKYTSSKFVYPLVSSSYANLKYQGSNKQNYQNHHIGNHQFAVVPTIKTTTSTPSKHYTENQKKTNITKLYPAIVATTVGKPTTSTTRKTTRRPITRPSTTTPSTTAAKSTSTVPITTRRPPFDKLSTKLKYSPTKKYTTQSPTTTVSSTEKQNKYTRVYTKFTTHSPSTTTTTPEQSTTTSSKNTSPRSSTMKITTTRIISTTHTPKQSNKTSTTIPTRKITTLTSNVPTKPSLSTSKAPPFFPMPSNKNPEYYLDLDSADVYHKINEKNEPNQMSLADIFNALAEDNNEESTNSHSSSAGLDNQGNLMQPIIPSQPSPFTLHQVTKVTFPTTRKPYVPTIPMITRPTQTEKSPILNGQKNQENNNKDNYVHYEVQTPNMMQYHSIPSMNNVVISPDQNSASFVLGSQQAVGSSNIIVGSVEKEPLFENSRPIQFGTVISEDINQIGVSRPQKQIPNRPTSLPLNQELHQQAQNQIFNLQSQGSQPSNLNKETDDNQETQSLLVSSNIRFPNDMELIEHDQKQYFSNGNTVNGHAQPVDVPQSDHANPLVFPKVEPDIGSQNIGNNVNGNHVVFQHELSQTERPLAQNPLSTIKHEVLTLNQHHLQNKLSFPQLPEDLTPPDAPEEPIRLPSSEIQKINENTQRPGLLRPPHLTPPAGFLYNEFTRRPSNGGHHIPNSDRPLPNILPQFRPNAKISQGHPTYKKEPGNIRVTHTKYPYPKRGMPPPFAHRRTAIVNSNNRYPVKVIVDRTQEANRRVYKLPLPNPYFLNRQYLHGQISSSPMHLVEHISERHAPLNMNQESYNGHFNGDAIPERLPAFEEDDYIVNDSLPPQAISKSQNENQEKKLNELENEKKSKLEPVLTLQMLHSHKKSVPTDPEDNISKESDKTISESGPSQRVYVVYPAKTNSQDLELTMPIEIQDENVKDTSLSGDLSSNIGSATSDYQNTPFSVVRDQPQEPILMVKNKPLSQKKDLFPYPLEKPDITFAEFSKKQEVDRYNRETIMDLSPRVVNNRNDLQNNYYQPSTEIPIAIAYTPTEPNHLYSVMYHSDGKFSYPNLASPVIPEIRDTQTEVAMRETEVAVYDTRGQNYEKDFMAPFYPSMSLGAVTDSPNGWSVYQTMPATNQNNAHEKNAINRADIKVHSKNEINKLPEPERLRQEEKNNLSTTHKSETDDFQPELQGGFKPIYPPGYKTKHQSSESLETKTNEKLDNLITKTLPESQENSKSMLNKPENDTISKNNYTSTEKSTTSENVKSKPTSNTTISSEKQTTTEKTKKKKETSLASLLFGDYEDYDYEEKTENSIAKSS